MDDFRTEKWTLEDGRRAERRVTDNVNPTGEAERVIELHVEDERPLRLQQKVIEKRKPFVYEREIHTVDKTGNVVEKKVESIEPKVQMQVVEHIAHASTVSALAVEPQGNDCHVTKEEMIETIVTAVRALKEELTPMQAPAPVQSAPVAPVGNLADEIGRRLGTVENASPMDKILWGIIIALVVGLGYVIFMM